MDIKNESVMVATFKDITGFGGRCRNITLESARLKGRREQVSKESLVLNDQHGSHGVRGRCGAHDS